jgi:hypothetical protein
VGNDCDVRVIEPLPSQAVRVELKPCSAKAEVVGLGPAPNAVDAVRDTLEQASIDQSGDRPPTHADLSSLTQGYEAPLVLSQIAKPLKGASHAAKYVIISILRRIPSGTVLQNMT